MSDPTHGNAYFVLFLGWTFAGAALRLRSSIADPYRGFSRRERLFAIALNQLLSFVCSQIVVGKPALFHACPRKAADNKKSLSPDGVSGKVLLIGFCAMVSLHWRSRYRLFRPMGKIVSYEVYKTLCIYTVNN